MTSKQQLIILPGWGGNEILWQHQCNNLKDIVDLETVVITNHDTVEKMADAVIAQAPESFVLVGHSLGGLVAQHIAIKYPQKVSRLILLATWTGLSSPELILFFKKMLQRLMNSEQEALLNEIRPSLIYQSHKNKDELLKQIKFSQSKFPLEGLINQTKAEINAIDTTAALHKIQCPTLIIYGRQDAFFTLEVQGNIAKNIPHAELAIIEKCGHMLSIEQPETVTALIRKRCLTFS